MIRKPAHQAPGSISRFAANIALAIALLCLASCDEDPTPPYADIYDDEESPIFATPDWSTQDAIAYMDWGFRDQGGATLLVDSLAGIQVRRPPTAAPHRVLELLGTARWSSTGNEMVVRKNERLWIYDLITEKLRLLDTEPGYTNPASWNPCDSLLAYASSAGVAYDYTIWIYDLRDDNHRIAWPDSAGLRSPRWFAGCDSLAFRKFAWIGGEIGTRICVAPASFDTMVTVLEVEGHVYGFAISPDGRFVSFHDYDAVGPFLRIHDRTTGRSPAIPRLSGFDGSWAPTGHRLVFVVSNPDSDAEVNSVLKVLDVDTGVVTLLH